MEIGFGIVPVTLEEVRAEAPRDSCAASHLRRASRTAGNLDGGDSGFARTSQRHADRKVLRAPGAEQFERGGSTARRGAGPKIFTQFFTQLHQNVGNRRRKIRKLRRR